MKLKSSQKSLINSSSISFIYLIISSLYIIVSDKLLLFFFKENASSNFLNEIQSYKGLIFVLLSSFLIYVLLKKREKQTHKYFSSLKKSQIQYQNLFKNMSHGVVYTTPGGIVTAVNQSTLAILGITEKEMIGKSIFDDSWKSITIDGKILEEDETPFKKALRNKKPERNHMVGAINVKTGLYKWLKVNVVPEYQNGDEEPFRVCITLDDVTLLKNYQDQLKSSKEQINQDLKKTQFNEFLLKEASKMAKIGAYEIYEDNKNAFFSDELYLLFGIPKDEKFPIEQVPEVLTDKSEALLNQGVKNCMQFGATMDEELEINMEDGRLLWVRTTIKPIYDNNKNIIGRRGVLQDITEYKKVQLELEKSEFSFREAGKMAKIGYWGYDKQSDVISWSDEIFNIYGIDSQEGVPELEEILNFFTEKSKEKLINATIDLATKGTSFELELNLINAKNENVWIRNLGEPVYNENNEIIGRRGVSQNITERKKAQEKVIRSEQRFKALVQEGSDLFAIINTEGYYTYMSPSSNKIIGLPPEVFIGKDAFEFVHPDDIEKAKEILKKAATQHRVVVENYRAKNHKNEWRWVETILTNMLDNEAVNGIVINSRDITDQVNQEEKLIKAKEKAEENELKMKEAQKLAHLGSWYYDVVNKVSQWSDETYNIWEIDKWTTSLELVDFQKIVHPKDWQRFNTVIENAKEKGIPYQLELELIMQDGTIKTVNSLGEPVFNDHNDVIAFRGTTQDVTKRKAIENELIKAKEKAEENELKMKEAQKIAKLGSWYYDVVNKVSEWSDETYNIWGIDPEKNSIEFLDHQKRIVPKDWEYFNAVVDNATEKGIPYKMELELIMPDASRKIVNALAKPVFNENNKVIAFKGTTQDITERKAIENQLRKAKEKAEQGEFNMNQASKLAKIGYWYYDTASQSLTWSDYIYRLYNLTPEDPIPSYEKAKSFFDMQSQDKITKATKELDENGTAYNLELRMINSENEEIWVRNLVQPVYNDQNQITGKRGIIQNITEEKNLKKLNQEVAKMVKIGSWSVDLEENTVFWSEEIHQLHETDSKTYVPNIEEGINFYREDFREMVQTQVENAIKTGAGWDFEAVIVTKNTNERWVRSIGDAEFVNGKCVRLLGALQDIDNRKKYENRLISLSENIPGVTFEYRIHPDKTESLKSISGNVEEIWGFKANEIIDNANLVWAQIKAGGQLKEIDESIAISIETKSKWQYQFKYVMPKTGKIRTHLASASPSFLADGTIVFNAIILDVTKAAKNEQLLNQTNKLAKIGSWEIDLVRNTLFWSEGVHQIYETDPNSYIPTIEEALKFTREDFREMAHQYVENAIKTGEMWDTEAVIVTQNKKEIWVRNIGNAEFINGECVRIYGSIQDINDRKQAEDRLQTLANNLPGVIYKYAIYPDGTDALLHVSGDVEKIWGFTANQVMENADLIWNQIKLGGDFEKVQESVQKSIETKSKWISSSRYVTPKGEVRNLLGYGTPSFLADGTIIFNSIILDNTQQDKNEQLLEQTNKLAKIGSWEVDLVNQTVYWSEGVHQIYETDPSSYEPTLEEGINFTRKDFREMVQKTVDKAIQEGTIWDYEVVIVSQNKKEKWIRTIGNAEFINGECVRIYGVIQDIDDIKQAEGRLKTLANNLPGVIYKYAIYPDGTDALLHVSGDLDKIWGFTANQVMENTDLLWQQIKLGGDFEETQASIQKSIQTKSKWESRFNYVHPTGEVRNLFAYGSPNFLADGTILFDSIILDNTQQAKNEALLNQTSKIARIGSWEMDLINQEGDNMYWSPMIRDILEIDEQYNPTLTGGIEFHVGESKDRIKKALELLITKGIEFDEEILMITATGKECWARSIGKSEVVNGIRTRIYGSYQDINEQKRASLQLERSLRALEDYKYSLDQSAIITFTDPKGEIISANENFCEISGYKQEELIGKNHRIINANHHSEQFFKELWETITSGKVWRGEVKNKAKDGTYFWVDTTIVPFLNDKGKPIQYLAIRFDITNRKNVEQDKSRFQETLENSLNEIYMFHSDTYKFSYVNKGAQLNLGYTKEALKKLTPLDIKPDHTMSTFNKLVAPLKNYEKEKVIFYTNHQRKDGSIYPVEVHLKLVEYDSSKNFIAIVLDITERKKAEKDLITSSERLRLATSSVEMGIFDWDIVNDVLTWDEKMYELYGVEKENFSGALDAWQNGLHPEDFDRANKDLNDALEGVRDFSSVFRVIWPDNSIHYIEGRAIISRDRKGNAIRIIGSNIDVTERIKAQENLVSTTERLSLASVSIKMGVWDWDIVNNKLEWDDRMYEIYGIEKKDFTGVYSAWQNGIHPDDLESENERLIKALESGREFRSVFRVVWPDQSIHFIEDNCIITRDEKGNPLRAIGSNIDITERKKAEEEILRAKEQIEISEAKFKSYTEKSPIAIFTTDVHGKYTYVNETWLNLTGMILEDALNSSGWLSVIHPDDVEDINKNWYKSVESKGKWKYEYRYINKKTNKIVWVEATAKEVFNDKNELTGYLGTNVNITERKKAEEMYRLLADNTNDIIALQEPNANLKYISPAVENLLGYKQDELLGKQFVDIIYKEDVSKLKEIISNKILKGIFIEAVTYRAKHKNGHYIWLESLISPVAKGNSIVSLVSTSRDVTQWMLAKREIEDYQSSLQRLSSEISLIEEKQKKEIAANIHDHLSQSLVISRMRILDLEKKVAHKNVQEDLDFIKKHISEALENSRKITYELSPPVLYQLGIIDALEWYADETEEKYGIKFYFNSAINTVNLSEFKSILLFRCIQEAVTNTIKYADASLITLSVIKDPEKMIVLLTDNGKGFDTAILNNNVNSSSGFGLFAVKERIRNLNGEFEIFSKINIGTKIKICVPLEG